VIRWSKGDSPVTRPEAPATRAARAMAGRGDMGGRGGKAGLRPAPWIEIAVLAVLSSSLRCHRAQWPDDETGSEPARGKQVRCAPAQTRQLQDTIEIHGTIAPMPDRDALIAAQVPGRILRVLVREGDRILRGQALARIDDAALRDQAKQAEAQVARARAESTLAGSSRARTERVFERGIAARQELDESVARLSTAEATLAEARASAEIINRQLNRAVVSSPLAGVVLRVFRKSGELVDGTGATPIVEVGDPSRLELVGTATAADLVQSRVGAPASIEVPAIAKLHLLGVVAAVSPAIDRVTGLGVVRVSLTMDEGVAPPVGITATARLEVGPRRQATVIPSQALRATIGARAEVVICGADRHAHVTSVSHGQTTGAVTELTPDGAGATTADDGSVTTAAPISPGTMVAIEPVLGIDDGDLIEVMH
jgi:RND family efflux transporter MFP subunit